MWGWGEGSNPNLSVQTFCVHTPLVGEGGIGILNKIKKDRLQLKLLLQSVKVRAKMGDVMTLIEIVLCTAYIFLWILSGIYGLDLNTSGLAIIIITLAWPFHIFLDQLILTIIFFLIQNYLLIKYNFKLKIIAHQSLLTKSF